MIRLFSKRKEESGIEEYKRIRRTIQELDKRIKRANGEQLEALEAEKAYYELKLERLLFQPSMNIETRGQADGSNHI